jgi:23S rRNA-/tRNA-specific pseudouridylate synthase
LVGLVTAQLGARDGAPVVLGVHQRLDRDTSGVVVFARSPLGNRALAAAFAAGLVRKEYLALVGARRDEPVPPEWEETVSLDVSGRGTRGRVHPAASGVAARTRFRVAARFAGGLRVIAAPQTGRKHQVRAHLAARGLPILGDEAYGGAMQVSGVPVLRVMLHARRLTVPHPETGLPLRLEAPVPADFAACERRLREG